MYISKYTVQLQVWHVHCQFEENLDLLIAYQIHKYQYFAKKIIYIKYYIAHNLVGWKLNINNCMELTIAPPLEHFRTPN